MGIIPLVVNFLVSLFVAFFFFFFNDPPPPETYTLPLPDALPICFEGLEGEHVVEEPVSVRREQRGRGTGQPEQSQAQRIAGEPPVPARSRLSEPGRERDPEKRSEEHTSELQSQSNLVCRLLLEKK